MVRHYFLTWQETNALLVDARRLGLVLGLGLGLELELELAHSLSMRARRLVRAARLFRKSAPQPIEPRAATAFAASSELGST